MEWSEASKNSTYCRISGSETGLLAKPDQCVQKELVECFAVRNDDALLVLVEGIALAAVVNADFVVGERTHGVGEDEEGGIAEERAALFVLLEGIRGRKKKGIRSSKAGLFQRTRRGWREA